MGILLIVLGLGGIAFFVYAQFFAPRRRAAFDDTGEIQEFTDISSDSSGVQQREDYLFGGESEPEDLAEPEEDPHGRAAGRSGYGRGSAPGGCADRRGAHTKEC